MTATARATRTLYTPEMLDLATRLAGFRWDEALPLRGEARSRACGSRIELALEADDKGAITRIGLRPHACAVGQAAAALFALAAEGRTRAGIAEARDRIAAWLGGEGDQPDWPGIAALEPALVYPGRHAAILLSWDAALAALP